MSSSVPSVVSWRDRDQVLLFGQPGHGVQDEVGVTGEVQEGVTGEIRVPDEQDRRLPGVLRRIRPGDDQGGERQRPLRVLLRVEITGLGRSIGRGVSAGPTAGTGLGQGVEHPLIAFAVEEADRPGVGKHGEDLAQVLGDLVRAVGVHDWHGQIASEDGLGV